MLCNDIKNRKEKIAVVGLGYVGMPLAVAFAEIADVIGFDINSERIESYKKGIDITNEVGDERLSKSKCFFTCDENELRNAKFIIVAVPTPIAPDKTPDLSPVTGATETVARNLTKGSVVVYESTVYPGVTEDICIPILEKVSGLKAGMDFKVGYSPERINPADKVHTLETIKKIVSGMDEETLETVAQVYSMVVKAGVYRAGSIKVAEAAKVVENSQRDINIAFMNELAMVFDKMGIDTADVVEAMNTKWNALGFKPGLVGGHCIGVDPYYFIYKAEELGYHSQIIMSGRKINDDMARFVGESAVKQMILADKKIKGANVLMLGITFKEDCPDVRNSKAYDIVKTLSEYGINVYVCDPVADAKDAEREYGIKVCDIKDVPPVEALVVAVGHKCFKTENLSDLGVKFEGEKILIDVKNTYKRASAESQGYRYWSL